MKTNQIFNFSRFGRYAKSSLILNYRQLLMSWGGMASVVFLLFLLIAFTERSVRSDDMTMPFVILFFVAGIIFAGISFPAFRKKEKTIALLTTPASSLERFVYEFLEKIVAFVVFYPPVFYLASNSAIFIRNTMSLERTETVEYVINGVVSKVQVFPYHYFSFNSFFESFPDGELKIIFSAAFLLFSIAFAGAATFRKYPLVKTIVFCGALIATVAGYMYFIMEKLRLQRPWITDLGDTWEKENAIAFACTILLLFGLIMLTYSYFKVKEKEAQ